MLCTEAAVTAPHEAILAWRQDPEAMPLAALLRCLVEHPGWCPPLRDEAGDRPPFRAFDETELPPFTRDGRVVRPLCSSVDAMEAYREAQGPTAFGDWSGDQVFASAWAETGAVLVDPGTPHEWLLEGDLLHRLRVLSGAVAVEAAWSRLAAGDEQQGDLALVAHHGRYFVAVARSEPDDAVFCEVENDDGRALIALFTHDDALERGWPEIAERYAGRDPRHASVAGAQVFPTFAHTTTDGLVVNFAGPARPAAFSAGVFELLLQGLERPSPFGAREESKADEGEADEGEADAGEADGTDGAIAPRAANAAEDGREHKAGEGERDAADASGGDESAEPGRTVLDEVIALGNEALSLANTRRRGEAEGLLRRALERAEHGLGTDHAATATCRGNLGEFLSRTGRSDEAVPLLSQAVAWHEAQRGADPAKGATPLANLALALRRLDRFAEAEPLGRRALTLLEQAGEGESLTAAGVLNNLAQVLQHSGRAAEAEPLMRRVIALFERHLGAHHPNVAIALNNLARLLEHSGRAGEAEPISRRHVLIFQRFGRETGEPHALMATALDVHADLLASLGLGLGAGAVQARLQALRSGKDPGPLGAEGDGAGAPDGPRSDEPAADFDRLSRVALAHGAPQAALESLFAATFLLPEWLFIARGHLEQVRPYVAANPTIERGAPMVKAFTDARRLKAFAHENDLQEEGGAIGDVRVLALPVPGVLGTMASLAEAGVTHVHFNADHGSEGYYLPLVQLPIVWRHLQRQGLLPRDAG